MKTKCPCCHQAMETNLPVVDLTTNTMAFGELFTVIPGLLAEVMAVLLETYPNAASADRLVSRVWGLGEDSELTPRTLSVHICRLRHALRPMGFCIDVNYGLGWKLCLLKDIKNRTIGNAGRPRGVKNKKTRVPDVQQARRRGAH